MVRGLFGLTRRKGHRVEEPSEVPLEGDHDGWVEMADGQITVHDPVGEGRYATLMPESGVLLSVNGELVTDPTAVTASDRIRAEVAKDQISFFGLALSDDEMAMELILTGDPDKQPDAVDIEGRHQARLILICSHKAPARAVPPKSMIVEQLRAMGVVFGIDQTAIDQALAAKTGEPVTVARGQEPAPAMPGEWIWRLNEWSMAEAGQVIALFQPGVAAQARTTVTGRTADIYPEVPDPPMLLPGNGTRMVGQERLVASTSGRARAVSSPQGERVHIFAVQQLHGDLTEEMEVQGDVIVHGSVRGGKITRAGEVYVAGDVEKSDIAAETITVSGGVSDSYLYTIPQGHFVPLRSDLAWVQRRIEGMREKMTNRRSVTREEFTEVATFIRLALRRADQMGVNHTDYTTLLTEVARVFMEPNGPTALDLPTAGQLLLSLARVNKLADKMRAGSRDIKAGSVRKSKLWAGRDIAIEGEVTASGLFAGGSIRTSPVAVISRSELVAGAEVQVGVVSHEGGVRTLVRAGARITAEQVQSGTIFESGANRREFHLDTVRVVAEVGSSGELTVVEQSEG